MQMDKQSVGEFAELIASAVVNALEKKGIVGNAVGKVQTKPKVAEKSAYAKTEALLYNYRGFQKIIRERMREIEEIKKYGVPRSCAVTEYVQKGGMPQGLVLEEESVESAVCRIQSSVEGCVQAIAMIDKSMAALRSDPYYSVLEMRYFEGRTQEDIALEYGVSQVTISNNKSRLVRELAMRIFPNQVIGEMLS